MASEENRRLADIVARDQGGVLEDWIRRQGASTGRRSDLIDPAKLRDQSQQFLATFAQALSRGGDDTASDEWARVREGLEQLSTERARLGFNPTETATFVFSLKETLFDRLRRDLSGNPEALASAMWSASTLLDRLGLYTTEVFQKGREALVRRQQEELLELSTPVVRLWENVLALPLIGTLDSSRTQVVMENLLQQIVETGAAIAIIDITGVPTVDTLVAQHLLKTVAAARLMGADCIISGIRPQIAQTIVHLGVELGDVTTKASLADAFLLALRRTGYVVTRGTPAPAAAPRE